MIHLKPVIENPFPFHPEFNLIWPHRGSTIEEDHLNYLNDPGEEQKYLVCKNDIPIGVTGHWIMAAGVLALSWMGIIPKERGKGFGREVLLLTLESARTFIRIL